MYEQTIEDAVDNIFVRWDLFLNSLTDDDGDDKEYPSSQSRDMTYFGQGKKNR